MLVLFNSCLDFWTTVESESWVETRELASEFSTVSGRQPISLFSLAGPLEVTLELTLEGALPRAVSYEVVELPPEVGSAMVTSYKQSREKRY